MVTRLLGRKLGMTQIFDEKGKCFPSTVIQAGPCPVLQLKTKDNDGYNAVQLGFGERRRKNVPKAEMGHQIPRPEGGKGVQKPEDRKEQVKTQLRNLRPVEVMREIPWDGKEEIKLGDKITVAIFETFKKVDVEANSKGRGFMGVVRRHGFHGLPATHGASDRERAPGALGRQHSISQGVPPGKKMAGHWGNERVSIRNLDVVKVDKENNLIFVHGCVPGPTGGIVLVKEAHWVAPKPSTVVSKKAKGVVVKK